MKTKAMILSMSLLFLFSMLALPSCKKEKEEVIIVPAYVPVFSATSITLTGADIDFAITCVTDDVEIIKVEVKFPGGLGNEIFQGPLQMIKDQPFFFPNPFVRISGTWTFIMTGYNS
jgi:hypothetical protein